ncbi:hypothetical protein GOP47_0019857 [Adiantum capillus-veneris]|uniref:Sec1 family domain-containing protein MIP3 n=1 Tax=Adiantum capillus-veneris TaxID=13818 RepID=A0A9D4UCB4_ADICA|nr:hypothetical protein GOP47_0019857 [Adiantum capillus-veneris]
MASINLHKACLDSFAQLAGEDVKDALVYMDAGAGQAFHFLGGLSALLPFGPRAVCSLENASAKDAEVLLGPAANDAVEKVLVITTHLLSHVHQYIHHCLQAHNAVKVFTVLTSVSEEAHAAHPDSHLGTDAFHEYKRCLMEDHQLLLQRANAEHTEGADSNLENLGLAEVNEFHGKAMDARESNIPTNADSQVKDKAEEDSEDPTVSFSVKIKHFPMIICPLTSRAFVFPSNGLLATAPLADVNSPLGIGIPYTNCTSARHEDEGIPIGGTLLAHFLHHLAGQLSLKFDVYTLGPLSNEVGKHLTELSGLADVSVRSRRPAGLLLMDRTLDLVTPSSHGDSLLDRIFAFSSRRIDEYQTKNLRASPTAVSRRALDVRVANGIDDLEEVWMPGLHSEEIGDFLSKYEFGEGLIISKSPKNLDGSDATKRTIPMLRALGSSLFDSVEKRENGYLDLILEKRVSDSLHFIETWLQESNSQESIESSKGGAISSQKIQSICNLLSQNVLTAAQHADLIQISKAVEMAIDPGLSSKWDGLLNAERVLLMSVGDSNQSIASQICDVVYQSIDKGHSRNQALSQPKAQKLFTLRDALTLAIVGYALAGHSFENSFAEGPFSREEEEQLKQAVVDAILQGSEERLGFLQGLEDSLALHRQREVPELSATSESRGGEAAMVKNEELQLDFSNEGWEAWDDEEEIDMGSGEAYDGDYQRTQLRLQVRDRVEAVFGRLHRVSEARRFLQAKNKSSVFDDYDGFGGSSSTRRSLIFKVLMLLFAKAEIPGMEHHASFVGRILKSGLGRFGLRQVKPKLSDNKLIMVFVIGGINGVEICEAKEAQAIYKMEDDADIVLGGTSFLTPDDVFDLLIGDGEIDCKCEYYNCSRRACIEDQTWPIFLYLEKKS